MLELPVCSKDALKIELQNYDEEFYSAAMVASPRSVSVEDGTFDELSFL